jgi:hypothetical protein
MSSIAVRCDVCGIAWTNIHETVDEARTFLGEHMRRCSRRWLWQWQARERQQPLHGFARRRTSAMQREGVM